MDIEEFIKVDNFEKLCKEKNIQIVRDGAFMLLTYGHGADFSDPIVRQARGIIFKNGRVVCRPFDKFSNYEEEGSDADLIDWDSARVQTKIDGSLINMFYVDGYWHFSTSGNIDAANAPVVDGKTFLDLIHEADNFRNIPFEEMDVEKTYMFELVGPYNRVIINYPRTHLYHIGTRDLDGKETDENIGIEKPKEYEIHSLDDCIKAAEALNPEDEITNEGFVVVDKDYHRIKVKSPKYILMHRAINNGIVTIRRILQAIREGNDEVYYRTEQTRVKYLEVKLLLAKLEYEMEKEMQDARALYQEYDYDRKATVKEVEKMKYPFAGFEALGTDIKAKDIMEKTSVIKLEKYCEQLSQIDK